MPSGRTDTERRLHREKQRWKRIYTPCKIEKVPITRSVTVLVVEMLMVEGILHVMFI